MSYALSAAFAYDAIYTHMKDYEAEAARLRAIVASAGTSGGNRWLNIGCGTGLHDQYLAGDFSLTGLDLSPEMLAVARRRLPEASYHLGNMVDFDLDAQFDVVSCLFSAIGHIEPDELEATIRSMGRHLAVGGVLIIEPWIAPDQWRDGHFEVRTVDTPEVKIARMAPSRREGRRTYLSMHYLLGRCGAVEYFTEEHVLTMFTRDEYLAVFAAAGLRAHFEPAGISDNGRGVYIATT